jgi:hypothetical protein
LKTLTTDNIYKKTRGIWIIKQTMQKYEKFKQKQGAYK